MVQDLRTFLVDLKNRGELTTVSREVDPLEQLGTLAFQSSKAVLFENLSGYPGWRILSQAVKTREQVSTVFKIEAKGLVKAVSTRLLSKAFKSKKVSTGPVKEKTFLGGEADLNKLPIPVNSEGDVAPFITAGLCIVKDPETGLQNMAIHRLQLKSGQRTGVLMVPRHMWMIYEKYEALGEPMPMAVILGHHPAYEIAAAYCGAFGLDEVDLAGNLLGENPEVVRCETIEINIPSYSEIAIEGIVPPGLREEEGPFGEFQGYLLTGTGENPVFEVKAITMRNNPIFRHIQSGRPPTEHQTLVGFPMEIAIYEHVRNVEGHIDLLDVHVPPSGGCFTVILQLTPHYEGQVKNALMASLSSPYLHPKIAIAVDEDVNIFDPAEVQFAVSTRVNPSRDVFIIEGTRNHPMDPSLPLISPPGTRWQRVGSKMGINATKPPTFNKDEREAFERVKPKGWMKYNLDDFD
jgi:2,5-furandicarboxylate decarboxylase 1